MNDGPRLLGIGSAAGILRCSVAAVLRLARAGELVTVGALIDIDKTMAALAGGEERPTRNQTGRRDSGLQSWRKFVQHEVPRVSDKA